MEIEEGWDHYGCSCTLYQRFPTNAQGPNPICIFLLFPPQALIIEFFVFLAAIDGTFVLFLIFIIACDFERCAEVVAFSAGGNLWGVLGIGVFGFIFGKIGLGWFWGVGN